VDEFTCDWEILVAQVLGISIECLIRSHITELKPHIQNKLKLHDITTMEIAIHKAKTIEKHLKDHHYKDLTRLVHNEMRAYVDTV
jgi:hypothetical protein